MNNDPYIILQVARTANQDEIEAAYRQLAKTFHPDLNKSPDATHRMQEINWAYDLLKDPDSRWKYDHESGWQGPPAPSSVSYSSSPFTRPVETPSTTQESTWEWLKPSTYPYIIVLILLVFVNIGLLTGQIPMMDGVIRALENARPTPEAQATSTKPAVVSTQKRPAADPDCIPCQNYKEITERDKGKRACVGGWVRKITYTSDHFPVLHFSKDKSYIVAIVEENIPSDVEKLRCVYVGGVVEQNRMEGFAVRGEIVWTDENYCR